MGYQLRRALADALPTSLQGSRRSVLLELADLAKDETGLAFSGQWGEADSLLVIVARRVGLTSEKQAGKALDKLAGTEFETRVQIGVKKSGQPLFCCFGRQTTYDIGALARALLPQAGVQQEAGGGANAPPTGGATDGVAPPVGVSCSPVRDSLLPQLGVPALSFSSTQLASSSKSNGNGSDKADRVLAAHGIPASDRPSIEQFLHEARGATSPGGLIASLGDRGGFAAVIPDWRAWAEPTPLPPHVNGHGPPAAEPCAHGCVGGWLGDPDRPVPCPTHKPHRTNGHRR